MHFFSTAELLEIGGYPFATPNDKPSRLEALNYYRTVAQRSALRIRPYHEVTGIAPAEEGGFTLAVQKHGNSLAPLRARRVIVATGYFDYPNLLGIPGEELPKVTHYYREAHPYSGTKVVIIGGSNSAIDAAMDLLRVGAEVTVVYRGEGYSGNIKPWVKPIFEGMVNKGRIRMLFQSRVTRIEEDQVIVTDENGEQALANDFVLALTGFRPDRSLIRDAGAELNASGLIPVYDAETMQTTVPGLYIAGVIASGSNANEVFIETGRFHGQRIASHIRA